MEDKELTFGDRAVGLTFNPSNNKDVQAIKEAFAAVIELLDEYRRNPDTGPEVMRMLSVAITEAQTAQMWGVKAVTWKED